MSNKQKIALAAPVVLFLFMYATHRLLANAYGSNIAWYAGFWIYWGVWGLAFPMLMIGKQRIAELIRPRKPTLRVLLWVAFPLLMTLIFRIITGTSYTKPNTLWMILVFSTTFGNGFFEEVLWRGVYMSLFPKRIIYRIIWPALWFALWHYSSGSLSPNTNVMGLMIGAGLFGLYLGYLALKTDTLWWCILAHTLGGIIMVA